jgi:hypothetical protein
MRRLAGSSVLAVLLAACSATPLVGPFEGGVPLDDGAPPDASGINDAGPSDPDLTLNWRPATDPVTADLHGVTGVSYGASATGLFVVGARGTILRSLDDGKSWSVPLSSPTTEDLEAVAGANYANVWAVGARGTIVHYDGDRWTLDPSGVTVDLHAVAWSWWGEDSPSVLAVGDAGTILRRGWTTPWQREGLTTTASLRAVASAFNCDPPAYDAEWGSPCVETVQVGGSGVLVSRGTGNSPRTWNWVSLTYDLVSLAGGYSLSTATRGWWFFGVKSDGGLALDWQQPMDLTAPMHAVAAGQLDVNIVTAVGAGGAAIVGHLSEGDASGPIEAVASGTTADLYGVWRNETYAIAVGANGTIVRLP